MAAGPSREAAVPVGALSRLCYCECHVTNPLSMPRSRRENKRGEVRTLPINRSPAPAAVGPEGFAGLAADPGSAVVIVHPHPARTHKSPGKSSPAVLGGAGIALNPLQVDL